MSGYRLPFGWLNGNRQFPVYLQRSFICIIAEQVYRPVVGFYQKKFTVLRIEAEITGSVSVDFISAFGQVWKACSVFSGYLRKILQKSDRRDLRLVDFILCSDVSGSERPVLHFQANGRKLFSSHSDRNPDQKAGQQKYG